MTLVPILTMAAALVLHPGPQEASGGKEFYSATAANTSVDIVAPSLFEIEITVDRYTTVAEKETLEAAFRKGGQEALLRAIQRAPRVGFYRVPGNLGYEIRAAFTFMGRDNRRRIILVTDRYVAFNEAAARPRSLDYPFTVFDMRVDDSGIGEGQIMVATSLGFDRNGIVLEEFLNQPIRLTKVRQKK
jgi:hypothetical protein